jgi:hypothetical protein
MRAPQRSPHLAGPSAAALSNDGPLSNSTTKHHSSPSPTEQGSAKRNTRQQPIRGGMAQGRAPSPKTYAVFDGQHCAGVIIAHGSRWLARTSQGRVLGAFASEAAAMAALPPAKVQP